jgi:hypothetical protein
MARKNDTPFRGRGRWRLVATDLWDLADLDLVDPAHITFGGVDDGMMRRRRQMMVQNDGRGGHTSAFSHGLALASRSSGGGCFRPPRLRSPCRIHAADGAGAGRSAAPAPAGRPLPGAYRWTPGR